MSKKSDAKAFEMYPENNMVHQYRRKSYSLGYDQATKDTIERIREWANKKMADAEQLSRQYVIFQGKVIQCQEILSFLSELEKEYE